MTSFWLAVVISVLSGIIFIWNSVADQVENNSDSTVESKRTNKILLIPILFLLLVPIAYYFLGNIEKHQNWIQATTDLDDISSGKTNLSEQMSIESMLLGLRTAIEQDPKNGQLWFMLAEAYFQLRMIDLADLSMQRAIRIDARPDWLVANAQILSARSNSSDISKSINLLQTALSIQPNHQAALLTLGFLYLRQQQYEFAIAAWQRLVSLIEEAGNDPSAIRAQIEAARKQLTQR